MQDEPTLSPEENQAMDPSGEENTNLTASTDKSSEEERPKKEKASETEDKKEASTQVKKPSLEIAVDQLKLEEFPAALEKILKNDQWMKLGSLVTELQDRFDRQFLIVLQAKKEVFIAEGGNEIDFYFAPDYKKNFGFQLREYKRKKSDYFKAIEVQQKTNLNRKKEIIDEIKQLIDASEHNNSNYRQFKNLQEAFHNTGQVPRAESNNIWQTYKFHVERFYDFLHLNRDLRDADFKHNYTEKLKIIERAEELAKHPDIIVAIRELNILHRLWKNDLGPVAREHREELWNRFQASTKVIHQRKNEYNKNIDSIHEDNLKQKDTLLETIERYMVEKPENHNAWQNAIKKVNELRDQFHAIGRVPKSENKRLWNRFRELNRQFNQEKNLFYKNQKVQEKGFIQAKRTLINEVTTILDDPNWRDHINRMKNIQNEWKTTGRISRRLSNKLWEEFRGLTNLYFDRLKNKASAMSAEDQAKLATQNNFVEQVCKEEAPTTPKKLERFIQTQVEQWNSLDPQAHSPAQKKLVQHLVALWDKTSLTAKEKTQQKFSTQLALIKNDAEALNREHSQQKKKIDEIATELIQLQNNLQFFSSSSNDNPLVEEVNAKIDKLSKQKETLEEKTNAIKSLKRALNKQQQAEEEDAAAAETD